MLGHYVPILHSQKEEENDDKRERRKSQKGMGK
jgi:hypothetical protein